MQATVFKHTTEDSPFLHQGFLDLCLKMLGQAIGQTEELGYVNQGWGEWASRNAFCWGWWHEKGD